MGRAGGQLARFRGRRLARYLAISRSALIGQRRGWWAHLFWFLREQERREFVVVNRQPKSWNQTFSSTASPFSSSQDPRTLPIPAEEQAPGFLRAHASPNHCSFSFALSGYNLVLHSFGLIIRSTPPSPSLPCWKAAFWFQYFLLASIRSLERTSHPSLDKVLRKSWHPCSRCVDPHRPARSVPQDSSRPVITDKYCHYF